MVRKGGESKQALCGYLPPRVKSVVDEIVDELAKDERVAAAYSLWQDMQDEVVRTYTDDLPERVPLSQQKEFKPVRSMAIRETLKLAERRVTFENKVFLRRQAQVLTALRPYESKLHCLNNETGDARLQHPLSPAVRTWHLSPLKISELIEEPEKQPSPTPKKKKISKK